MSKVKKAIPSPGVPVSILDKMIGREAGKVEAVTNYLDNFKTDEDKQAFFNYKTNVILKDGLGIEEDLFNTYEPMKGSFNEDAKILPIEDKDTPKTKALKTLRNSMVLQKGKLAEKSFIETAAGNSMTAGWVKMGTGGEYGDYLEGFSLTEEGIDFKGDRINFDNQAQADLLSKAIQRLSGADRDKSFLEMVGETAVSLTMDIPLMLATGGIVGAGMKGASAALSGVKAVTKVGKAISSTGNYLGALTTAPKGFEAFLGTALKQSINFNLLGMPQTVQSLDKEDYGQAASDVFHNVAMGSLAATTTGLGKFLFANKQVPIINKVLENRPAFAEEIAGVMGGFGFGVTSSKFAGMDNRDALATGLAFAATHFTNPTAYKRVLAEHKNKNIRVRTNIEFDGRFDKEYFQEEGGQLHKIDSRLFNKEGIIKKLEGHEPLELTEDAMQQHPYYNTTESSAHLTVRQALTRMREGKNAEVLADRMKEQVGEKKFNKNEGEYRILAEILSAKMEVEKLNKVYSDWRIPSDSKLHNKMVEVSKNHQLPYSEVKRLIYKDISAYIRNEDAFVENVFRENIFGEEFAKDYVESLSMAHKLLGEGVKKEVRDVMTVSGEIKNLTGNPEVLEFRKQFKSTGSVAGDLKQKANLEKAIADKFEKEANDKDTVDEAKGQDKKVVGADRKVQDTKEEKGEGVKETKKAGKKVEPIDPVIQVKALKSANKEIKKLLKGTTKGSPQEAILKDVLKQNNKSLKKLAPKLSVAEILLKNKKLKEEAIEKVTKKAEVKEEKVKPIKEEKIAKEPTSREDITKRTGEIIEEIQKIEKVSNIKASEIVLAKLEKGIKLKPKTLELIKEHGELERVKHEKFAVKEKKGAKAEDISSVATPENRFKNLIEDFKKNAPRSLTKDREAADKMKAKFDKLKGGETITEFAKKMGLNKLYDFIFEAAEKSGATIRIVDNTYNPASYGGGEIRISKKFFGSKDDIAVTARMGSKVPSNIDSLTEMLAHETVHHLLKDKKFANIKERGEELANEIWQVYKIDKGTKGTDIALEDRIAYMTQSRVLPGERPFGFEELFAIGLNEPAFAKYLDSIPSSVKIDGKSVSMFGRLKDIVRSMYEKVLGLTEGSRLDELNQLLDNALLGGEKIKTPKAVTPTTPPIEGARGQQYTEAIPNHRVENLDIIEQRYGKKIRQGFDELTEDGIKKTKKMKDQAAKSLAKVQNEDTKMSKDYIEVNQKGWEKIKGSDNANKLVSLYSGLRTYANLNLPPIFYASMSPKFRDEVYAPGEEMIRGIPDALNKIHWNPKLWNKGKLYTKIVGTQDKPTVEGQHILDSFKAYEKGRYENTIKEEWTWDEFADAFNFNANQKKLLKVYEQSLQEAVNVMKESKTALIRDFNANPAEHLSKKALGRLLGKEVTNKNVKDARAEVNDRIKDEKDFAHEVADEIVNKQYRGWGTKVYYNSIRPVDPNTWLVDITKPGKRTQIDKDGNVKELPDRISTYFDSRAEAQEFINKQSADGWKEVEGGGFHQIKDLINRKEHFNKLNSHQLMELANAGHIPLTNEIIAKLMDATKKGVDLHTIRKDYIPGMKYDVNEFEKQFDRFTREAVYGGKKAYALTSIDRNLEKWQSEISSTLKSTGTNPSEAKRLKSEFEYAQRYANQLRQGEHSYIDALRGATINFQIGGIKPAFIFQQASQVFQTTFSAGIADAKSYGLTTGDAIKAFNNALGRSIKVGVALRGLQKGEAFPSDNISKATLERIQQLERMNKIGSAGIEEFTAEIGDLEYKHEQRPVVKGLRSIQKVMNIAGKSVEKWSRIQTALTFEEIGLKRGLEGKELVNFMADGIDKSLAEWGKGGRAPIFDSPISGQQRSKFTNSLSKAFLTYKTFSYYNYGLWRSMIKNKQYSALASKAIVGMGMHGITKFPMFASLGLIADLFSEDEETLDYEMWQYADDMDKIVPGAGGIIHRGVGSVFGIDFRNTFGESTPLATDLYAEAWSNTWNAKMVEIGLGAPYGFTQDAIKGLEAGKEWIINQVTNNTISTEQEKDTARRIMLRGLSPVFIRNVFNAFNMEEDGIQVSGKSMVFADDLSALDIAYKAMSFPIEKQTRAYSTFSGGVEQQYNKAKQIVRKGATHRKEFIAHLKKEGIKGEDYNIALREEMKRVGQDMIEARAKMKELEKEVKQIKRDRRINERKQLTN